MVNLREVSVFAAQERWEDLKETVANSLKLVIFMAVPSAVGLMVMAIPIVRVIFQRGGFTASDTRYTAYAVMGYSLGLFAYSCMKVYVPTFYALNDTRTPVRISLTAVGANLVINLFLVFVVLPTEFRYVGLALGTALSVCLSTFLLAGSFRRKLGSLEDYGVLPMARRTILAAALMGVLVHYLKVVLGGMWLPEELVGELVQLGSCILAGVAVYFGCSYLLGVREGTLFFQRLKT